MAHNLLITTWDKIFLLKFMSRKDYYKILSVDEKANDSTIKKAYRKLAKENHPDTHPGDTQAEKRFKEVSEAYSVLSDSKKRPQYDQMRKFGFGGPHGGGGFSSQGFDFDLSDILRGARTGRQRQRRGGNINMDEFFGFGGLGDLFSQMFESENGFGASGAQSNQTLDIHANLEIPFETAIHGGKVVFDINKNLECPDCAGNGAKGSQQPTTCPDCNGSGMIGMARGTFALKRPCPRCLGKGKIISDPCPNCRGSGRTSGKKKYSVNISPGVENGKKMCLRGQGNPRSNGRAGDLILSLNIGKHKFFKLEGLDTYCEILLKKKQVKKGAKVRVKTVYGDKVDLKVPPKTADGKVFRMKGLGLRKNGQKGDQYVKISLR